MVLMKSICRALEHVAPLRLAEKWDNVGLLLEAPFVRKNAHRVILTIDLTNEVAEEALNGPTVLIVSYHPTIFKPISSLTLANPLQRSLLRLAAAGVSVYSPHTALDSVHGGINDWLAAGISGAPVHGVGGADDEGMQTEAEGAADVTYIGDAVEDIGGQGRIVTFKQPVSMFDLQARVKRHLNLEHIQVAYPAGADPSVPAIRTVAICAGAGGSMFHGVQADAFFTGEMQHHEVLAAVARGSYVLLCGHTNTERGYLPTFADKLRQRLHATDLKSLSLEELEYAPLLKVMEVRLSEEDKHPLRIV